jgi:hypothetical protein
MRERYDGSSNAVKLQCKEAATGLPAPQRR